MTDKIRLGVVGTGRIFKMAHLQPLLDHPEVEIVAVCDLDKAKAEKIAEQIGISAVYEDYKELLKRGDLDAVDICTSNLFHSEIAVAALEAGIHVFCEKPDAVNPVEARKMADAAQKSGKLLMTMRNNRFTPESRFLKSYIENGHMGEIYTGRCGWIRRRGIPGKGSWFTTKELSGGGPLIDLGVHMLDLALWFMGNPKPVAVSAATYNKFTRTELSDSEHSEFGEKKANGSFDVEDLAIGFIRLDNGATLQIEFSWASNIETEVNFVELRGTQSGSCLAHGKLQLFTETNGQLSNVTPVMKKETLIQHGANLHHFIDCLFDRAQPTITPEQGVDMIKILTAIYKSAELGQEVRLS